jgi:hypothetical protein
MMWLCVPATLQAGASRAWLVTVSQQTKHWQWDLTLCPSTKVSVCLMRTWIDSAQPSCYCTLMAPNQAP